MRSIAGLDAWGEYLVQTYHYTDGHVSTTERELWLSTLYKMPLMQIRDDPRMGMLSQEVVSFEAGEPDAALFEAPADYAVRQR
jgi:hypothetical protein